MPGNGVWHVYILLCRDGSYYVGMTSGLAHHRASMSPVVKRSMILSSCFSRRDGGSFGAAAWLRDTCRLILAYIPWLTILENWNERFRV